MTRDVESMRTTGSDTASMRAMSRPLGSSGGSEVVHGIRDGDPTKYLIGRRAWPLRRRPGLSGRDRQDSQPAVANLRTGADLPIELHRRAISRAEALGVAEARGEALGVGVIHTRPRETDDLVRFPAHADISLRLVSILDDPDVSVREVAALVASDPGLSARTLRLANSPYFGLSRQVGRIEQAVVLLGFSVLRALAVSVASGMLATGRASSTPSFFWEHSVSVAAGAVVAARIVGHSPGEAFTAGLLHDLGAVIGVGDNEPVILACDPRLVAEEAAAPGRTEEVATPWRVDVGWVEEALMGSGHAQVGALLLEEWRLPTSIVEAVRDHHELLPDERSLGGLVAAGEALAPIFARLQQIDAEAARRSAGHEAEEYLAREELSIIEQVIAPTLERARIARVQTTDVLQALRAESARFRALIDLAT
jgi:HD-like signal output (HDOD) protein